MKVGILTYHNAINYGGVLQAYALQQVLNSIDGIEVEDIDYRSPAVEQQYHWLKFKNKKTIKNYILSNATTMFRIKKRKNFESFLDKNMKLSQSVTDFTNDVVSRYDAIIVGSDQVWNPLCTDGDAIYLLNYPKGSAKKIAYAVSMGNADKLDLFASRFDLDYKKMLSEFYMISTREADAGIYLSKMLGKECRTVVDPVFLYGADEWKKFSIAASEPYILTYNLGNFSTLFSFVRMMAKKTGLKIVSINKDVKGDAVMHGSQNCSNIGPEEFVSMICNAKYIVTDSFHATAFSIMFNKNFYTIGNNNAENTNSRLLNVLKSYGLEQRYITDGEMPEDFERDIHYSDINEKIEEEREASFKWLMGALTD